MPIYQGEAYLKETLASIAKQTRLPDEVVMSDDDSRDTTLEIVGQFAKTAQFEVKLLHHHRCGITANYQNALRSTSGDVIIFSDQDDFWLPNKIEVIEKFFLARQDVSIVSSDSALVDKFLQPLGTTLRGGNAKSKQLADAMNQADDFLQFLKGLPLLAHTLAIRAICKAEILDKPDELAEWWFESWVVSVAVCHGRLALIEEVLTLYRQHTAQVAGTPSFTNAEKISMIASYERRIEQLRYLRKILARGLENQLLDEQERERRLHMLDDYIDFLKTRITLRHSVPDRWRHGTHLLLSGYYHRYARGWLSFAKDLISK